MITRWLYIAGVILCLTSGSALAQSLVPLDGDDSIAIIEPAPPKSPIAGIDFTTWTALAERAEALAEGNSASRFALSRIRAELVTWRDEFSGVLDLNGRRLETVQSQIAALTPANPEAVVSDDISARLEELQALEQRLLQPRLLAKESFARANGLISEIDGRQRDAQTERLLTRGASPLNPTHWPAALSSLRGGFATIGTEIWGISAAHYQTGSLFQRLLLAVAALGVGGFIFARARSWITAIGETTFSESSRLTAARRFGLSLLSVVGPMIGLFLVLVALEISGLFGVSSTAVLGAVPVAGAMIFVAIWLADYYFPTDPSEDGVLGYDAPTRVTGRRMTIGLGWSLAALVIWATLVATSDASAVSMDVLNLPFQVVIGVLLWQLGRVILQHAKAETDSLFVRSRVRVFIGRAAQVFALAGPIASMLGYGAAAAAITVPAVMSLAVVAVIVLLQRLSYAVASPDTMIIEDDDGTKEDPRGLLPVTINFALAVVALPVLALIWGASTAELLEIWTRFLNGFSIGDVNISPSNFLTFIVVFAVGMLLTRFVKTTLKTTVMPRTGFDLGGQNAVVAGAGYVGIFLSALVAFGVAGIDLSSLAIVAGALSVGIGFGLQNIVSNFVSGIILLIERPVSEGDMIEVGGQTGYVRDISVRSTRIETFDRRDVIIPNADLVSNQVTNLTRENLVGRAILPVGVAYGTDTKLVTQILREIAENHPLVLINPPPSVLLMGFGADSIDFEIRAIVRDVNFLLVAKSEMFHEIVERFEAAGIEIPFAQRDLWLRNPEVLNHKAETE